MMPTGHNPTYEPHSESPFRFGLLNGKPQSALMASAIGRPVAKLLTPRQRSFR